MYKGNRPNRKSENTFIILITKEWYYLKKIYLKPLIIHIQFNSLQLFLDDSKMKNFTSCFKEKKFLHFFFKNLKINETDRYLPDFPYISLCGRERNYIRCDDYPIVYTHILSKTVEDKPVNFLSYAHAGDLLTTEFCPQKIFMLPETGRIYHPAPDKAGSIGLVMSKLAIELSKYFEFKNGESNPPTHFNWNSNRYELDLDWYKSIVNKKKVNSL